MAGFAKLVACVRDDLWFAPIELVLYGWVSLAHDPTLMGGKHKETCSLETEPRSSVSKPNALPTEPSFLP